MEIPSRVKYSPGVRGAARALLRPIVAGRRVPGTPLTLRFPAWQHLGLLTPGGMRSFEPELSAHIHSWVRPGHVALDVGANVGFYSLLLAHLVGPTGAVHAFEPDPQSSRWLLENVRLNRLEQVTPWLLALSSADGVSDLHLDLRASRSTSLVAGWGLPVDQHRRQRLRAATARLDSLEIDAVDFIKIDVEGAELEFLIGARDTLSRSRPVLLIEVLVQGHFDEVMSLLANLEYDVADAKTGAPPDSGRTYSSNLLATPRQARRQSSAQAIATIR